MSQHADLDWRQEKQRVETVEHLINKKIEEIKENTGGLKEGVIELRKSFWEDVTVNLDDAHEIGETFTSIKQQAELLSERERTHKQFYKKLVNLIKLKDNPYFGRVDFKEKGESDPEEVYIGITSLMDENDEDFLIYDWRAPISSLYYNFSPGPAHYEVPEEKVDGEISLKRQYIIRNGQLKSMFDTGVTIGDELLQEVLSNSANTQMKSIVATIQKEQNQIIRNETSKYLIVQGAAGSGKTSAALQRVAYLLYRYRGKITSDNIMLFSPNYLFNSYVSTVLPELGEENMRQSTFFEYIQQRVGKAYEVEDPFTQMEFVYGELDRSDYDLRLEGIRLKSSKQFKDLLDKYITHLSQANMSFKDIVFRDKTLVTRAEIEEYFYSLDKALPIPNRINLVMEWLIVTIKKAEHRERKKDWVLEEIELLHKEDYLEVYREVQSNMKGEDSFDDFEKEQELLRKKYVKTKFNPVYGMVKKFRFINMKDMYEQFIQEGLVEESSDVKLAYNWKEIVEYTTENLRSGILLYEDATPFLYLTDKIEGRKGNSGIRHLFIDEGQDYSIFQFNYLKYIFPNSKMTILGDFNQGIYAHSIDSPSFLPTETLVEENETSEQIILSRSYRSTKEIVEFTSGLIPGGDKIEPFNRPGKKPTLTLIGEGDKVQHHQAILKRVKELRSQFDSVAIICKTGDQSEKVYEELRDDLEGLRLIKKDTTSFEKGTLVLPSYLAKGIEFDAVVVYDASGNDYGREMERKLFYTVCTRAMHELHLFSNGEKSPFINDATMGTYETNTV
ncbi:MULTISPECIES: RNA polymerase recycling motor HelD [Bacillaceae]|uniref:AAA family ATPase n=1 Tax=Evansella alkalicola TaxID=745819 RepID=A0ABS6JQM7_9BACI|nr:RNA polymerase recycling motor HelD [Litchfieldia alkalitelluris]MBU9720846.1 AAA family ATPase [Bacillus alkalicola]